jgi:transcriptional regulator with XRE-family HTH domain
MEQSTMLATPGTRRRERRHLSPDVGASLRRARQRQSRTAEVAARRAGISVAFLRALERGDRAPSLHTARALIATLDLTLDEAQALVDESVPDAGRSRP